MAGTRIYLKSQKTLWSSGMNVVYILKKRLEYSSLSELNKSILKKYRVWVDINEPSKEELERLSELFDIHPLVLEDFSNTRTRPKSESFSNYEFIVMYGLYTDNKIKTIEIDYVIGKEFLISSHWHRVESYEELKKDSAKIESLLRSGVDTVLHHLIDLEIDNYMPIISSIDTEIEELEKKAVHSPTPQMLAKLFDIKRQLLQVRKVAGPQRDVLFHMTKAEHRFISHKAMAYFRDIYDHIIRINDQIETYREVISSILEVHLSVTSNRLNEIMKVLTIITTILMPITAIAGIYGMNFQYMPELEWHYGYFVVLALMLSMTIGLLVYSRKKGWF